MKKLLSIVLCIALAAGACVSAMAENSGDSEIIHAELWNPNLWAETITDILNRYNAIAEAVTAKSSDLIDAQETLNNHGVSLLQFAKKAAYSFDKDNYEAFKAACKDLHPSAHITMMMIAINDIVHPGSLGGILGSIIYAAMFGDTPDIGTEPKDKKVSEIQKVLNDDKSKLQDMLTIVNRYRDGKSGAACWKEHVKKY